MLPVMSKKKKKKKKNDFFLGRRKENRSDGFLLWTLWMSKKFPSSNQIAWNVYKHEELELLAYTGLSK